jgi:hypothetical protein
MGSSCLAASSKGMNEKTFMIFPCNLMHSKERDGYWGAVLSGRLPNTDFRATRSGSNGS